MPAVKRSPPPSARQSVNYFRAYLGTSIRATSTFCRFGAGGVAGRLGCPGRLLEETRRKDTRASSEAAK